jgi:3-dehydroquinate synthase
VRPERDLRTVGLPAALTDIAGARPAADVLIAHMAHDKKAEGGKLTFILTRGLGKAFVTQDVPGDALREILSA